MDTLNGTVKVEKGVALIKPEFIVVDHVRHVAENCMTVDDKKKLEESSETNTKGSEEGDESSEPPQKKRLSKQEKKKLRGQNKARPPTFKLERGKILCHTLVDIAEGETPEECTNQRCSNMHNVKDFLAIRPADLGTTCYNYEIRGRCPRGLTCRFGAGHITEDGYNKINRVLWEKFCARSKPPTINSLPKEVQVALRKHTYDFSKSEKILSSVDNRAEKPEHQNNSGKKRGWDDVVKTENSAAHAVDLESTTDKTDAVKIGGILSAANEVSDEKQDAPIKREDGTGSSGTEEMSGAVTSGAVTDEDIIKLRPAEKKKIDWRGKLSMTPLTTVGNLPFRRICKEFGVDVTCGEMAMASALLQGLPQEWALVKRHESEDIFGVQLCGNNPYVMTRCAQVLEETIELDFIDINLGCPIDLVYQQGGGSGLLRRQRVLHSVVQCMNDVMTIPLTVKTRTGISSKENIAHKFMPGFRDWGASLITVHGRSREQRYTRMADWNYIDECAKIAQPVPVFGNGDILSHEDYKNVMETYKNVSGAMIGRGALIKPWIFTEIKEERMWDISSKERFDILKKYANYGLEHWGSDTKGVENTRRFLLEWLSFLHRYIPVGILERPPQKINERPPVFRGRDDLETLMASPNCAHWVEISEMLLGPVPEGFNFLPKHKANSWK